MMAPMDTHPLKVCTAARDCPDCNHTGLVDGSACPTCQARPENVVGLACIAGCAPGEGQKPVNERCQGCPNA